MVDMAQEQPGWDAVVFIKRSKNRLSALKLLRNPLMPSELAKEMKISLTHGSKIVRELYKQGLVECLNNNVTVGRIYRITKKGSSVLSTIEGLKQ